MVNESFIGQSNLNKQNMAIELYWAGELKRCNILDSKEYKLLIENIKQKYNEERVN